MNPLPSPSARTTTGGRPALAAWHAGWAAAVAILALGGRLLDAPGLEGAGGIGLLVMVLPGLAGLALLWRDGPGPRAFMLGGWTLAATAAAGLTGGLSGALAAFTLIPFAAAVMLDRPRLTLAGAAGTGIAILAGLAATALTEPGVSAPVTVAVGGLMVLIALASALRLTDRDRIARLDAAEDSVARVEALLSGLPGLTLVLEPSGRVLAAYGAAPPALPVDPLFDQGLIAAVHAPDRPAVLSALDKALSGQASLARFAPRLALDRRVVMTLRPLTESAGARRVIALAFDDTGQYAQEVALETARAEAEAQSAGKTRFLANMSHELRTPLNAVLGFSDIMRQRIFGPLPDRYGDYAENIHQAGGHLLDLINDVLDVSKIEAERYALTLERFDAREVVSAAMALIRVNADDKGVSLSSVLPGDPVEVSADRRALKQIALNLLSNAVKFTPRGGSVTVTVEAIGPYLEVVVADTGVGIAPEDVRRLGRPFEQAGEMEQRRQGTGLGLSLVRAFAELHGGRMSIDSTLGEGTAVTVRLPVALLARAPAPEGGAEIIQMPMKGGG